MAECDGSDRQKWHLTSQGEIVHLPSGKWLHCSPLIGGGGSRDPVLTSDWSGKCLDADGNNGNEVELYTCLGYSWQRWELRQQTLRNRALGGCLDVKNCPGRYSSQIFVG